MKPRESCTHEQHIEPDFCPSSYASAVAFGSGVALSWPAVEQMFVGSQAAHLNEVLSAPCQKDNPAWLGQRAESPAAAGDMNVVLVLHICF